MFLATKKLVRADLSSEQTPLVIPLFRVLSPVFRIFKVLGPMFRVFRVAAAMSRVLGF